MTGRADSSPGDGGGDSLVFVKSNVKRTVLADHRGGRPVELVKRFHAPGLSSLRDGWRARSEAEALRNARSCGLPVPIVESVGPEDGTWTLRLRWIEGARSLEEVLARPDGTVRRRDLARRLGEVVATAERVGLRHPDPHPQNVLVDAHGKPWLIDLARARFSAADPARFRRMMVLACARLREISTPGFRASVFRAFLRAHRVATETPEPLSIEEEARALQRRDVERRVDVWCRTSSATELTPPEDGQRVVRVRAAVDGPAPGWRRVRRDVASPIALEIWGTAVRLTMHRIPTVRPVALGLTEPCFVELDVPDVDAGPPTPEAAEALRVLLADRGLVVEGDVLTGPDGSALVGVGARLVPIEERRA